MTRSVKKKNDPARRPTGNVKFGKLVAELREKKHLSQALLAAKCGIGRSMMNHVESGKRRPSADELYAMGLIFDRDMSILYKACSPEIAEETEQRVWA